MNESNSMVIFTKAALMLAEADTIQKAKELNSLALTALEWAKRRNMGREAEQHCRSYALEAERKMGGMLAVKPPARGAGPGRGKQGAPQSPCLFDIPSLAELGISKHESSRAQKLAALPSITFDAIRDGKTTLKDEAKPHVAQNSGDHEWYTPKAYAEAARSVLGKIELDPASTVEANKIVKAERIYTAEENGLKHDWKSKTCFVNPPYDATLIGKFIDKLADSVKVGSVTEAIVLVNNATETKWFVRLAGISSFLCFPTGRVKFWHPRKESMPLQGQAVAYIGKRGKAFCREFRKFGILVEIVS
ncbi:MAG: DNA N-6-adenine-methyltransferase [bacterium]